ncbi:deoxyribodipyrimidine photolyase [Bacteriovorax stolpii]|uniref:Deoxyribodipyrimidine photo-lyase n=1 Tax=Bacteriovorax stolpii TaxID=960 RepID=A0A2K9NT82_BACTC|nr:deoxyribodipyrimidine photo-lyase [Bacteriovorax stolpii]AUN98708.1 deoxyribodipyrimidine photolyase [Bacteriovorax stolpii]TDP55782.1 deoxyribodipyrimidine photo-lyase type I [Bacteriovorax stolpii]
MKKSLVWLRRDLRLHDHYALSESLKNSDETYVAFIFDSNILEKLHNKNDSRVTFIMDSLKEIESVLNKHGSSLIVRYGNPVEEIPKIIEDFKIEALFFNRDYEPYAKERDQKVEKDLFKKGIHVFNYKDHVFFEKKEVLNGQQEIYKVFTPYKNKWLEIFHAQESRVPEYKGDLKKLAPYKNSKNILEHNWYYDICFVETESALKGGALEAQRRLKDFKNRIEDYKTARDVPSIDGTSLLSPYIRMGNLSIRDMIRASIEKKSEGHQTWLSEIIWRDFYQMILDAYPGVDTHCFRTEYDQIKWLGKKEDFEKWCNGETGYPLVDAAMRCLNTTGMMHNRLRMVVASFLTKTLLIDWRWGERYFAEKLLDYDMAANNGGWQWSASTGVDAQPYFRIFNPYNQSEKFDPKGDYIKMWCPELAGFSSKTIHHPHDSTPLEQAAAGCFVGKDYPHPIVAYKEQRERALSMYKAVK